MDRFLWRFILIIIAFTVGCTKNQNNPTSFVDSYTPHLLDPKGTIYEGDYFPLTEGLIWKATGTEEIFMNTHAVINVNGTTVDTVIKDTSAPTISSTQISQASQTAVIAGQTFTVTPIIILTCIAGKDSIDSTEMSGLYEELDSSIVTRAVITKTTTGYDTMPAQNAIFLKHPLVVGDHWETTPSFALGDVGGLAASTVKDLKIHSIIYVIGKDTLIINGKSSNALRLDQAFEMSFTLSDSESNTNVSTSGLSVIYLVKDTGEVKETRNQTMTMKISMSLQGGTATSDATIFTSSAQQLVGFTSGAVAMPKIAWAGKIVTSPQINPTKVCTPQSVLKMERKALLKATCLYKALLL